MMDPKDFCYFLQGALELMDVSKGMDARQTAAIKAKLDSVFAHEPLDNIPEEDLPEAVYKPTVKKPFLKSQPGPGPSTAFDDDTLARC